ncbi:hypothetical protein BaRGS_00003643 [Batillaria attramentaria]|uniref:Uncharacterized protein n=1 Tax=Batillaria attramentaria TaxID=370345 RepID=A0ABD0M038_9CAEN
MRLELTSTVGSSSMSILLKVCDVKFLVQHVQTKESEDEVNIPIGPNTDDGQLLMQVICNYVANGQLMEICQHPILQDPMFLQEFVRFCDSNKNYLQKFLSATDTVHNMKLLYWSIWGLGLCFTNWCLATMRDVKADENALLNSLLKAVCVCLLGREQSGHGEPRALTEADNQEGTGIKMLLQKLSTAPSLSVGSFIDIPIPEEKQCFTAEAKAKRARLISNAWEGRHCYLGNSLLADREVDERDEKGNTVLHLAAEAGEQEAILLAVRSGASAAITNDKGQTPVDLTKNKNTQKQVRSTQSVFHLHEACKTGDKDTMVVEFLTRSVSVHDTDDSGQTSLHAACEGDQADVASLLISLKADVNARDESGNTPLSRACYLDHHDSASLLIEMGSDVNVKNNRGRTPLHISCDEGHQRIVLLLLDKADVNAANSDGETAFHEACLYGNTKAARLLKDYGADPGLSTGDGDTALHLACRGSHRDSAEFVLQCGVDIDAKNNKGETALYQACRWHRTEMVRFLLGHGAGTDRATEDGDTPLHVACRKGWDDTTDLLLENSADLRAKNCRGNTPLHTACSHRHTKIASLLIRRKIKDIETHESTQPVRARLEGQRHSTAYLKQLSCLVNARNNKGESPLYMACRYGDTETSQLLLQHYAEVDDRTHSGDTPLDVASRKGHRETKDVLIEHGATIKSAVGNNVTQS